MKFSRFFIPLLCFAAAVSAQRSSSHLLNPKSLQAGLVFQMWKAGGQNGKLQEWVAPIVFNYTPNEKFGVSILNTPTRATYTSANQSSRLLGLTDTKISTAFVLGEEKALVNFGVNLPSGKSRLDPNREVPVATTITNHALRMPTSYFGGGWEASAGLAWASEWSGWVIGAAMSGIYKDDYIPVAGSGKYRPGPEISLSLGADRVLGEHDRIFGDVSYTWYGKDQLDGQEIFQADGKISLSLAGIFAPASGQISVVLQNRFKRKSPFALNNTLSLSYGNELDFAAELARENGKEQAWLVVTNLLVHGANEDGLGKALLFGFGPGWRGHVSAPLQLEALARYAFGKLNDNSIWGIEANLAVVWEF